MLRTVTLCILALIVRQMIAQDSLFIFSEPKALVLVEAEMAEAGYRLATFDELNQFRMMHSRDGSLYMLMTDKDGKIVRENSIVAAKEGETVAAIVTTVFRRSGFSMTNFSRFTAFPKRTRFLGIRQ